MYLTVTKYDHSGMIKVNLDSYSISGFNPYWLGSKTQIQPLGHLMSSIYLSLVSYIMK